MQKVIPPMQKCVKAGFLVFKPEESARQLIIVNEGQLIAFEVKNGKKHSVFEMHPGDLIGVASLLEKEKVLYHIEAVIDSKITIIDEECMESQLTKTPVWIVALMKSLSLRTRELKKSRKRSISKNTLQSLACFLYYKKEHTLPLAETVLEFSWQTRCPIKTAYAELKYLNRKNIIQLKSNELNTEESILIDEPLLLSILIDYISSREAHVAYPPFQFNALEKECMLFLSTYSEAGALESNAWLKILQMQNVHVSVSEIIRFQEYEIFSRNNENFFSINRKKVNKYLLAIQHENNIKKLVL